MVKKIKHTDYILSIFSTHSVYLDANILLDEKTCKAWKNAILPRLARCNHKFIVIASVMAEIRKKADTIMSGDAALAYRARKALDDINNLVQQNLCEIKEVEVDSEFADSAFYSLFAAKRLQENILLKVCSKIMDPVTTTDELIPSGETSSYRSNPLGLAKFTLSRRDPDYVGRSKEADRLEKARTAGENVCEVEPELKQVYSVIRSIPGQETVDAMQTEIGSMIYAVKPGDGSAREQAASCQRVIGGLANITKEYATKRYRSNVMNWGMIPFQMKEDPAFEVGDYIYVPGIRAALDGDLSEIPAWWIKDGKVTKLSLYVADMTEDERKIVKAGCLINYNRIRKGL